MIKIMKSYESDVTTKLSNITSPNAKQQLTLHL